MTWTFAATLKLTQFRGVIEDLVDYGSVVAMWPSVSYPIGDR